MKITRREKYAILLGGCFVLLYVVVQFVIFPFIDKRNRLERLLETQTKALVEMHLLKTEYESLNQKAEFSKTRFSKRPEGFTLFSFLDKLAGECGVKENVAYMKPSKIDQKNSEYKLSTVEMKLQGITMHQLNPFLYKVEMSENHVSVRRMSISKTSQKEGYIDVVMQIETYEL